MIGHSFLFALLLLPQQAPSDGPERQRTFSEPISGSANETGTIIKSDTRLGYGVHRFGTLYGGVPLYLVHGSSAATSAAGSTVSDAGLGNIYGGLRLSAGNAALGYSSNVSVAPPTGGFSTGKVPVDWNNTVHEDNTVTQGSAEIVNDKGFSTLLTLRPQSPWNLKVGYNRSATYGLDSVFFGLGLQVSR